jgi:hypothetical protein
MLRFLHMGQIESQSRRRFRDLLILLLRCAIIVLIAMLFARPRLAEEPQDEQPRPVYYLGLDNSMSMAYSDGSASYFDKMLDGAVDYIRSADDQGQFNIAALASGDFAEDLDKGSALAHLRTLSIVPHGANIEDFLDHVGGAVRKKHRDSKVSVLVVSDFTPNTLNEFMNIEEPAAVDRADYRPIVSAGPADNASVVDAHVSSTANGKLVFNVTVVNYGQVEQSRKLTATVDEQQSAPVEVKLPVNQRRTYPVTIDLDVQAYRRGDSGANAGILGNEQLFVPVELTLSDDDGLREDDTYYLAVSVPQDRSINVLVAGDSSSRTFLLRTAINALSQTDSYDTVSLRQRSYDGITRSDLDWANVMICSAVTDQLGHIAVDLRSFAEAGGKVVFFLSDKLAGGGAQRLWSQEVLPALPEECVRRLTYIQPRACSTEPIAIDKAAEKSLFNYRLDKIALTGYLRCKPHPESICVWRLQNGLGFIYARRLGNGTVILVNTSIDDSLGSLTKSSASVAFCRYLLGPTTRIGEHSFTCDEQVVLPASDMELKFAKKKQFWVESPNGRKRKAMVADTSLVAPSASSLGWVKTLTKPARYAGINLSEDETDMARPGGEQVAKVMDRAFISMTEQGRAKAGAFSDREYNPIWNIFAWIIIALLLLEPAIANRLKR